MNSTQICHHFRLGIITFVGFFISVFFGILSLPFLLFFWIISRIAFFSISLKLGNKFTRPSGLDVIQGMENVKSRPFINTVGRFKGTIDVDKFCRKFTDKIIQLKDNKGRLRYKRFTQTYEEISGYHVFRDIEDFDIRKQITQVHLRDIMPEKFKDEPPVRNGEYVKERGEDAGLLASGDYHSAKDGGDNVGESPTIEWETIIERAMEKYGSRPIPAGRPKWEILLIEEIQHYTMLFRMHHSYCDGVYFVRFLLEHIGDEPVECKLPYNYHQPKVFRRFIDYLWAFCLVPYGLFRLSFSYEKNPLHGPELSGEKMFLVSKKIPLHIVKEIKGKSKTSMSAIFFTCMSTAIAAHFRKKKSTVQNVIALVPISLQDLQRPIKLKNRFALIGILLPTFLDQNGARTHPPLERLHEVQASCDRSGADPSFLAIHWLLVFICSLLPSALVRAFFSSKGLTTSMSNIVGPQDSEFYFTGARKTEILFWIPDRSPLGMGVSVIGFEGNIRIGLMIDKTLMPTKLEGYNFIDAFVSEIHNLHGEISTLSKEKTAVVTISEASYNEQRAP